MRSSHVVSSNSWILQAPVTFSRSCLQMFAEASPTFYLKSKLGVGPTLHKLTRLLLESVRWKVSFLLYTCKVACNDVHARKANGFPASINSLTCLYFYQSHTGEDWYSFKYRDNCPPPPVWSGSNSCPWLLDPWLMHLFTLIRSARPIGGKPPF